MFTEFIALATILSLQFTAYTDILIIDIKNDALITLRINWNDQENEQCE